MNELESLEQIRKRYERIGGIPRGRQLTRFITEVHSIVSNIARARGRSAPTLSFNAGSIPAFYDPEKDQISISTAIAHPAYLQSRIKGEFDYETTAVAAITGLAIHEANHSVHSGGMTRHTEALGAYIQIVEDHYIEFMGRRNHPYYEPFMDAVGEVFFSQEQMDEALNKHSPVLIATAMKNGKLDWHDDELAEQVDTLLNKVRRPNLTMMDRVRVAEELKQLAEEASQQYGQSAKEVPTQGQQFGYDESDTKTLKEKSDRQDESAAMAEALNEALEEQKTKQRLEANVKTMRRAVDHVKRADAAKRELVNTEAYDHFGRYLSEITTIKTQPNVRSSFGKLDGRALWRTPIDSNVFAVGDGGKKPQRIGHRTVAVVLISDISGSTALYAAHQPLYAHIGGAMHGLIRSFERAGIKYAAYAHHFTGYSAAHGDRSEILPIAANGIKLEVPESNLDLAIQATMSEVGGSNCDAEALTLGQTLLKKVQADVKLVVIVSDGSPTESMSNRLSPLEETTQTVKSMRAKGIKVVSISVAKSAWDDNDRIYGAGDNLKVVGNEQSRIRKFVAERIAR